MATSSPWFLLLWDGEAEPPVVIPEPSGGWSFSGSGANRVFSFGYEKSVFGFKKTENVFEFGTSQSVFQSSSDDRVFRFGV